MPGPPAQGTLPLQSTSRDAWYDLRRQTRGLVTHENMQEHERQEQEDAVNEHLIAAAKDRRARRRAAQAGALHFPSVCMHTAGQADDELPANWEQHAQLVSRVQLLLRLRSLRESGLALMELSDVALEQIADDLCSYGRKNCSAHAPNGPREDSPLLGGYSQLDLTVRVRVNMRLRGIGEEGLDLDLWPRDALEECLFMGMRQQSEHTRVTPANIDDKKEAVSSATTADE